MFIQKYTNGHPFLYHYNGPSKKEEEKSFETIYSMIMVFSQQHCKVERIYKKHSTITFNVYYLVSFHLDEKS